MNNKQIATEVLKKLQDHRKLGIKRIRNVLGEDFVHYEYTSKNMEMFEEFIKGETKGLLTAWKNEVEDLEEMNNFRKPVSDNTPLFEFKQIMKHKFKEKIQDLTESIKILEEGDLKDD